MPLHLGVVPKDVIKALPKLALGVPIRVLKCFHLVRVQDARHKPAELLGVFARSRDVIAQTFAIPELNPVGGIFCKLTVVRAQSSRGIFGCDTDLVEQVGDRVLFQGLVGCRRGSSSSCPCTFFQKFFALVFRRIEKL